jgi:hypothetical protein
MARDHQLKKKKNWNIGNKDPKCFLKGYKVL